MLTSEGKHGGIRHHLDEMVSSIPDQNPIKALLQAIESLSAYATAHRYPTAGGRMKPAPSRMESDKHARFVQDALNAAVTGFRVDLSKPNVSAGASAPIR